MNKFIVFFLSMTSLSCFGQSFNPAPGNAGTNAIPKDSSCFVAWATGGTIQRGYIQISDTNQTASGTNRASYGDLTRAFGQATNDVTDVVSLGDSGIATLTFDYVIYDGPGYDFAIFENGFSNNYMEFAHVEVSSDGVHFFRFPSISEVPLTPQQSNSSFSDCRMVNNLAGKYRVGFGTPFDLADLTDNPDLDKNNIRYIKLIDVIGDVSGVHSTYDSEGTIINDPFPTPFESGGFDLEAIGVINGTLPLAVSENEINSLLCYPNPTTELLYINTLKTVSFELFSTTGVLLAKGTISSSQPFDCRFLASGNYLFRVSGMQNPSEQLIRISH